MNYCIIYVKSNFTYNGIKIQNLNLDPLHVFGEAPMSILSYLNDPWLVLHNNFMTNLKKIEGYGTEFANLYREPQLPNQEL